MPAGIDFARKNRDYPQKSGQLRSENRNKTLRRNKEMKDTFRSLIVMDRTLIGKSKEDYLEAILIQINKNGACRSTDVATQLGFSKPSASIALKKLEEDGYIIRDDWKIVLTDSGREIAQATYEKHAFFTGWLERVGIDKKTAEDEACLMEHIISRDSFLKIREYLKEHDPSLK